MEQIRDEQSAQSLFSRNLVRFGGATLILLISLTGCQSCIDRIPGVDGDNGQKPNDATDSTDERDAETAEDSMCDGSTLVNTVQASDWVRNNTKIERYTYRANADEDDVDVNLVASDESSLGTLEISGFFGGETSEDSDLIANLKPASGEPLKAVTNSTVTGDDSFKTRTRLTRGEQSVEIQSSFGVGDCYSNTAPSENAGHPCKWPAPTAESEFSVPTCGFGMLPRLGFSPNLTDLRYLIPVDEYPSMGGIRGIKRGNGSDLLSSFDAVSQRGVAETQKVKQWLKLTGANSIIGQKTEVLLSTSFSDPAWIDDVRENISKCASNTRKAKQELSFEDLTCDQSEQTNRFELRNQQNTVGESFRTKQQSQGQGSGGCGKDKCEACGGPHLRTYDGSAYNFHAAGEFVFGKAKSGDPYEVQARVEPVSSCHDDIEACKNLTVISAVALQIGTNKVGVYLNREPHLVIEGEPKERITPADLESFPPGTELHQSGSGTYEFQWPDGATLKVRIRRDKIIDLYGTVPKERMGQIQGLWGYYSNLTVDDFKTRRGNVIQKPPSFEEIYHDFADSWRVRPEESLFDYKESRSTQSYTIPELPKKKISLESIPDELKKKGTEACSRVRSQPHRKWCVLDVVCLCSEDASKSTEELSSTASITDATAERPLTAEGDICIGPPESLAYEPAQQRKCPSSQTEPCVHVFRENGTESAGSSFDVDISEPGEYRRAGELTKKTLETSQTFDSYLLHLNEVPEHTGPMTGRVIFPNKIVGVATSKSTLGKTDTPFGLKNLTYPSDREFRGLDWGKTDGVKIGEDKNTLSLRIDSKKGIDQIRVFTKIK